jgi:ADP-heptose:LPS heptosyltransferase
MRAEMTLHGKLAEIDPKSIVVLRALQLGDLLCSIPAFRALKEALPDSNVTLIGLPWSKEFVQRFSHYLDGFIELPGYPGLPETRPDVARIPGFLSEIQRTSFDLALQLHGSGQLTNPLIALLGAKRTAGFYIPEQYCPDESLFYPYPVHAHEIHTHLEFMEFLGAPSRGDELEFPITPDDLSEFEDLKTAHKLTPGEYICVHPGSRAVERRWPGEKFAAAADMLSERDIQVVLTGSENEVPLVSAVAAKMKQPVINLAGQTSLGSLGALIDQARLVVCNDTGVSHVAAALKTPSVVLFTSSDPNRWAPLDSSRHRMIAWASAATPQMVIDEVDALLEEERSYAKHP